VAASAALDVQWPGIADARDHGPAPDPVEPVLVQGEPDDRADRRRREEEADRMAQPERRRVAAEQGYGDDPGEAVVREAWMADVGREEKLVVCLAGYDALAVGQAPCVVVRRIDADVVELVVADRAPHRVGEAEPPPALPVRRPRRDQVGALGQGPQMLVELLAAEARLDRGAVAEDVEWMVARVHDAPPRLVRDPGLAQVPFGWDRPVEDRRPARHLVQLHRHHLRDRMQALAHAVAGEAPR